MLTLAIDSSQDIGTLALGCDSQLVAEYHFRHKMDLLRRIMPITEELLADAGHSVRDIEGVIVSLGPGSFTGLRIGVTVAKSLAYTLGKPLVGIGTLDAIARGVAPVATELICPMIFARTDEVYWSIFDAFGTARLADYQVSTVHKALDDIQARAQAACFCGTGATKHAEQIRHKFGNKAIVREYWSSFARGAALLDLGNRRLHEGNVDDPFTLTPLYIRKPTPVVKLETGTLEKSK